MKKTAILLALAIACAATPALPTEKYVNTREKIKTVAISTVMGAFTGATMGAGIGGLCGIAAGLESSNILVLLIAPAFYTLEGARIGAIAGALVGFTHSIIHDASIDEN
jgi:hypothetical protein